MASRSELDHLFYNQSARWHDGEPITADDVVWSFKKLTESGLPFYRYYYSSVASVKKIDKYTVTFHFKETTNRELPLIVGQLPGFTQALLGAQRFL